MTEELAEVTDGQLRALRELRFVTVNVARTIAYGYDADPRRVEAVGFGALRFPRAPGVWDCQFMSTHPRITEEVEKRLGLTRG
jgi:hypothetical protein